MWHIPRSGLGASSQQDSMLRVATAQIAVTRDIDENAKTIERAIGQAIAEKADILLTPEGSLSGYTPRFDQQQVEASLQQNCQESQFRRTGLGARHLLRRTG